MCVGGPAQTQIVIVGQQPLECLVGMPERRVRATRQEPQIVAGLVDEASQRGDRYIGICRGESTQRILGSGEHGLADRVWRSGPASTPTTLRRGLVTGRGSGRPGNGNDEG